MEGATVVAKPLRTGIPQFFVKRAMPGRDINTGEAEWLTVNQTWQRQDDLSQAKLASLGEHAAHKIAKMFASVTISGATYQVIGNGGTVVSSFSSSPPIPKAKKTFRKIAP